MANLPPVTLLRREDLLSLTFSFINLKMGGRGAGKFLTPEPGVKAAFLIVEFPPQSFGEEAAVEMSGKLSFDGPPGDLGLIAPGEMSPNGEVIPKLPFGRCRASGPTRLVFRVPQGVQVPYSPKGLLDWKNLVQHTGFTIAPPTAIEAPYGLAVVPVQVGDQGAGWAHSPVAVTREGRTELWHTRLATRVSMGSGMMVTESAVIERFVRAFSAVEGDDPGFTTSLSDANRAAIVESEADVQVGRLMLSPLGAWMDVRANWGAQGLDSWQHRATMGRDHYVRFAEAGYLYPFGHRALRVKITERKFAKLSPAGADQRDWAWLAQRTFIVVLEREKVYGAWWSAAGRQMPFKSVRVSTVVTPDLSPPKDETKPFLVKTSAGPYHFPLTATDADGHVSDFTSPLVFVSAAKAADLKGLAAAYGGSGEVSMPGAKVTYAAAPDDRSGVTAFETSRVVFGAVISDEPGSPAPPFHPVVNSATVRLPAVEQVTGVEKSAEMAYAADYLSNGFSEKDQAQVFANLKEAIPASLPPDKSGGLVKPEMSLQGLSRSMGVVPPSGAGGVDTSVFGGARLLGGIKLASLLPLKLPVERAPRFSTRTIYKDGGAAPEAFETTFEWSLSGENEIKTAGPFSNNGGAAALKLSSVTTTRLAEAADPDYRVRGALTNFGINLAGIVQVQFDELTFEAAKDKKLDFSAVLSKKGGGLVFLGALSFLNALAAALSKIPEGLKDPPFLDVAPDGVTAGFTQGLPPITLGVMSLDNISFTAALTLPFSGDAPMRARFAFCERQNPFHLFVYGVGGGGFLGVAVGLDGVETIEAALEFGGSLALNLGPAAGVAYVMAGIYFKAELKAGTDGVAVTGYLRCGGELEVLGLVCVSVEFYMGLTYEVGANKLWGQAKLTIEVEVAFFSESVELEVRREFTNSARFTFREIMPPEPDPATGLTPWEEYCEAFAA